MNDRTIYVVERGEKNEGGSVIAVCRHWTSAKTCALKEKGSFGDGTWAPIESGPDEWEWENGCDYVRIRRMEAL